MLRFRQLHGIFSRFYPTAIVLAATSADWAANGGSSIGGLGYLLGCMTLPQVIDLGIARRNSIEAAMIDGAEAVDRHISRLTLLHFLLAVLLSVPAFAFGLLNPALVDRFGIAGIAALCLLGCLTAPLSVATTTAIYGWRHPTTYRMTLALVLDLALGLAATAFFFKFSGAASVVVCGLTLLTRQVLYAILLGVVPVLIEHVRRGFRALAEFKHLLCKEGRQELTLSVFCFCAWSIDPFLYAYFDNSTAVSVHLTATRVAQAVIGVVNIVLISALWSNRAGGERAEVFALASRHAWLLGLVAMAMVVAEWTVLGHASADEKFWIVLFVVTGLVTALGRQNVSLQLARLGVDLRRGATVVAVALVVAGKIGAVAAQSIYLLETTSVVASAAYLLLLIRSARGESQQ